MRCRELCRGAHRDACGASVQIPLGTPGDPASAGRPPDLPLTLCLLPMDSAHGALEGLGLRGGGGCWPLSDHSAEPGLLPSGRDIIVMVSVFPREDCTARLEATVLTTDGGAVGLDAAQSEPWAPRPAAVSGSDATGQGCSPRRGLAFWRPPASSQVFPRLLPREAAPLLSSLLGRRMPLCPSPSMSALPSGGCCAPEPPEARLTHRVVPHRDTAAGGDLQAAVTTRPQPGPFVMSQSKHSPAAQTLPPAGSGEPLASAGAPWEAGPATLDGLP